MKNILRLAAVSIALSAFLLVGTTLVMANLGTAGISGSIYHDTTCNGLDLSDKPLANVSATLISNILIYPLKTKSDTQGNFHFSNLAYGLYVLSVNADKTYQPLDYFPIYRLSEINGSYSEIFVFCKK